MNYCYVHFRDEETEVAHVDARFHGHRLLVPSRLAFETPVAFSFVLHELGVKMEVGCKRE